MSGIFHSLKKTLVKGDARPDVEFLDAKTRFEQYAETLIKLKGNIQNYLNHATALYISSSQIAQDFTTLIEDPDIKSENEYSSSVVSCRQEHQTLASEMVPKLQNIFSTQILAHIDEECVRNSEIQKRIVRRIELFSELGYYQRKVNELRSERESRAGKGKPETASEIDKFQRNQKKLDEVQVTYTDAHDKLMSDLAKLWDVDRIKTMGPILSTFIKQEKKFASAYNDSLELIKVV